MSAGAKQKTILKSIEHEPYNAEDQRLSENSIIPENRVKKVFCPTQT